MSKGQLQNNRNIAQRFHIGQSTYPIALNKLIKRIK